MVAGHPVGLVAKDVGDDILADPSAQVVVDDHPLVVPADGLLTKLEQIVGTDLVALCLELVDDAVVELQEGDLKLGNDEILVVARISNDRPVACGALKVGPPTRESPETGLPSARRSPP